MTRAARNTIIWLVIGVLFLLFIIGIRAVLLPFVLGILIAYFLDPVVDRIETKNVSRGFATALVTISFFAVGVVFILIAFPLVSEQLVRFVNEIPNYTRSISNFYRDNLQSMIRQLPAEQENTLQEAVGSFRNMFADMFTQFVHGVVSSGATILNILSLLLITPVVTFYMLRDFDRMVAKIDSLLPRAHAPIIREQMRQIDDTISGFIRGQTMVCAILATFYIISFSITGLKFGLVIGAATGFLIIIPYVGWAAGAITAMLVALLQYDSDVMIMITAAILIFGQLVESYFLTPQLVGNKVGLHPVWLIFGMLAGGALFGFVGVLIAVPVTAVIGVLTRFAINQYLTSELYKGDVKIHHVEL